MTEKEDISIDPEDLKEGHIYAFKNGELREIEIDPDDTMRKLRVAEEAVQACTLVQKSIRKKLGGYKPDLTFIASALLIDAGKSENQEASMKAVKSYYIDVVSKLDD